MTITTIKDQETRRAYWRERQVASRQRRRDARRDALTQSRRRRRAGRNLKVYCDSAKCHGHWVSVADLERERQVNRPYFYQRVSR